MGRAFAPCRVVHNNSTIGVYTNLIKLSLGWDLDGDTKYNGNPVHFYCDTGGFGSSGVIRARWGTFGIVLTGFGAAGILCHEFQVKWSLILLPMPAFCVRCPPAIPLPLPWVKFAGGIAIGPHLTGEVLYADQWWKIP